MKKIFTLLFAVGFLTAAYAQTGSRDTRNNQQYGQKDNQQYGQRNDQQNGQWDNSNVYGNGKDIAGHNDSYGRGMEMQIAQINRKYDFQIQRVQNDFFMRRNEKMRTIRSLEAQRQQEIRMMYANPATGTNIMIVVMVQTTGIKKTK